jgi:hypothetical protein
MEGPPVQTIAAKPAKPVTAAGLGGGD